MCRDREECRYPASMTSASVGRAAGLFTSMLLASHSGWNGREPPLKPISEDGSYLRPWPEEDSEVPPCDFWNASVRYSHGLCAHFAIARMSSAVQASSVNRALQCATAHSTDCVLAPEIGLSVPAAFVYDQERGLKMLVAPKLEAAQSSEKRKVALHAPDSGSNLGVDVQFETAIKVHYLEGVTRMIKDEVLYNESSYCVQMLRMAFADDCWEAID